MLVCRSGSAKAWSQKSHGGSAIHFITSKLFFVRAKYHLHVISVPGTPFPIPGSATQQLQLFPYPFVGSCVCSTFGGSTGLSNGMPTFSAFLPGTKSKVRACHSSRIGHFYHLSTCRPCPGRSKAKCTSASARRGDNEP